MELRTTATTSSLPGLQWIGTHVRSLSPISSQVQILVAVCSSCCLFGDGSGDENSDDGGADDSIRCFYFCLLLVRFVVCCWFVFFSSWLHCGSTMGCPRRKPVIREEAYYDPCQLIPTGLRNVVSFPRIYRRASSSRGT